MGEAGVGLMQNIEPLRAALYQLTWVKDRAQVDSPRGRSSHRRGRGVTLHTRSTVCLHSCHNCVGLHGDWYILVNHGTGLLAGHFHTRTRHNTPTSPTVQRPVAADNSGWSTQMTQFGFRPTEGGWLVRRAVRGSRMHLSGNSFYFTVIFRFISHIITLVRRM